MRVLLEGRAADLAVMLSRLPADHELVVAARLGVELGLGVTRVELRDISRDISTAADWRRIAATHRPHTELQRRRGVAS